MYLYFFIAFIFNSLVTYCLSALVEFVLIKRVMDNPIAGFIVSILLAGVLNAILAALMFGIGGIVMQLAGIIGALLIGTPAILKRLRRDRERQQHDASLFE